MSSLRHISASMTEEALAGFTVYFSKQSKKIKTYDQSAADELFGRQSLKIVLNLRQKH